MVRRSGPRPCPRPSVVPRGGGRTGARIPVSTSLACLRRRPSDAFENELPMTPAGSHDSGASTRTAPRGYRTVQSALPPGWHGVHGADGPTMLGRKLLRGPSHVPGRAVVKIAQESPAGRAAGCNRCDLMGQAPSPNGCARARGRADSEWYFLASLRVCVHSAESNAVGF
jgi:hypothetical protein